MKKRRRDIEIFSLSFLDCICCGFGAVLLLFVLTVGKKSDTLIEIKAKIDDVIGQMEEDIAQKDEDYKLLRRAYATQQKTNSIEEQKITTKKKFRTELEDQFALLLEQLASMEEALDKLLKDKENMPTQEEEPPIPIPNEERRQYLTGFDLLGDNVLFLVEASGGMLDDTYEGAGARVGDSDNDKRNAPKWVSVKKGLRWLIANLKTTGSYKIIFFNDEIHEVESTYGQDWFNPSDNDQTLDVLKKIDDFVPNEGANLERAFDIIDDLSVIPDRVVLIVDGLPTLADSYDVGGGLADDADRMNMFRVAKKALTAEVPINVLLYPMKNDPGAAVHYWRLSDDQGGAMVCPSKTWPNI